VQARIMNFYIETEST